MVQAALRPLTVRPPPYRRPQSLSPLQGLAAARPTAPPRRNSARPGGAPSFPSPLRRAHGTFTEHPHHEHRQGDTVTTPPPYPPRPAPYGPPRPPKKPMSTGAIVAIVLGSVFGAFILIVLIAAIATTGGSADDKVGGKATSAAETPSAQPSPDTPTEEPAEEQPIKVTAKKTKFSPGPLYSGGDFTSVEVTVVNNSDEKIRVSVLYFTITDATGNKHEAEYGEDKRQIDSLDLEPGERTTGVITSEGKFTPAYVTYTDGFFGEGIRANVS